MTPAARYQYTRYHDGTHWIVVDTEKRETVGFATCAWDAGKCADHLNRGLPVAVDAADEPAPSFRAQFREWMAVGAGSIVLAAVGYVGLVLFVTVAS